MQEVFDYLSAHQGIYPWGVLIMGGFRSEELRSFTAGGVDHACFIADNAQEAREISSYINRSSGSIVIDQSSSLYASNPTQIESAGVIYSPCSRLAKMISKRTCRVYNILITSGLVKGAYDVDVANNPDIEAVCVRQSRGSSELIQYIVAFENIGFWFGYYAVDQDGFGYAVFMRSSRQGSVRPNIEFRGVNVALNKLATQSSLYENLNLNESSGIVTGKRSGCFSFHTDLEDCPWWEVDLGSTIPISQIVVFNRMDAGILRSRTLKVLVRDAQDQLHVVHDRAGRPFGGIDGRAAVISCYQMPIKGVRVQLAEMQYLHLDTVEIYSTMPSGYLNNTFKGRQTPFLEHAAT